MKTKAASVVVFLLVGLSSIALAHEKTTQDATGDATPWDVEAVKVVHTDAGSPSDTISWTINFSSAVRPDFRNDLIRLDIDSSDQGGPYVLVEKNPDGGYYGEVLGHKPGFARVWWTGDDVLSVEMTRDQLSGRRLARRAHWAFMIRRNPRSQEEADSCSSNAQVSCVETVAGRHRWQKS